MKIVNFVTLALSLVLAEAMSIDPRNIEPRNMKYVAPGSSVTFASNASFGVPMRTDIGMFSTNLTANLSASCTAKLLCSGFSFAIGIGSGSQLLGYMCTTGSAAVSLNPMTSVGGLNLIMFSGFSSGSQYSCQIRSIAAITTTTRPITTTTRPITTTTRPITTTTRPITTTTRPITTTTRPITTTTRPITTTTRPITTTTRPITTTTRPITTTTRPISTTTRPLTSTASPTTGPVTTTTKPVGTVCQCGTIGGPKIVGGTDVTEGEIPWQVGLGSGSVGSFSIFCGGTLISSNFVITAAHCIKSTDLSVKIFLGSVNLKSTSAVVVGLSQIMPHESYNPSTTNNDIVVMRLASSVTFTSRVFPACLPRKLSTETFTGKSLVVSGWGTIQSGGSFSPQIMQKATVVGISNADCNAQYGSGTITSGMLCAAAPGKDSCQGDSGGPLTYTVSGITYLVGVVSFGQGCADPKFAGVYARVTQYLSWIDTKTGTPVCSK